MDDDIKFSVLIFIVAIILGLSAWITCSYFESNTYNKLTHAHTTTWDAMWVELRVQDSPK